MKRFSIFNHVLGPVMRGPSSSHTAGAYHLGCMVRSLAGGSISRAAVTFDPNGSYARTYAQQGADRAFAMGFMGKPLTDESFFTALEDAPRAGLRLLFQIRPLEHPDHPNAMMIDVRDAAGEIFSVEARSIGGGDVEIISLDGIEIAFNGSAFELFIEAAHSQQAFLAAALAGDGALMSGPNPIALGGRQAFVARRSKALSGFIRSSVEELVPGAIIRESAPVYLVQIAEPLFFDAEALVRLCEKRGWSLGRAGLEYETRILGLRPEEVIAEMLRRYDIMAAAAARGLDPAFSGMQLLAASAGSVFRAEAEGRLALGGPSARAAARALAVMHVNSAMGVVCAAPTGGSAGTIPGTILTLAEERHLSRDEIALSLLAAGVIGVITAQRATFAAEVAGCQVEIGAAGAMAAAAVVDACGGSARQACDAAAIAYQNTMGSVCDLVQGLVEIPCHTRNAVAAASAFVCADLVLGGYANPIPLDETIDAVYSVGRLLPAELRCTARGGLALTHSALAMKSRLGGDKP
ncbi:MAG: L-serine ammonia-lyase, iron-sulfur-dependent, subunit alpha [Candidatus Aminicenantes bacterium]|nr:L-serine ammonia-lyase, iron-sulfur-dependent, subunit alpha [Candidatus Aminicenantes bacterium]